MSTAALYDILILVCAAGVALGYAGWRSTSRASDPGLERSARAWIFVSFGWALVAWILRWIEADHWPIFGTWESALSLALAVLAVAAGWSLTNRQGTSLVVATASAVAAGILAHARGYDTRAYALTISERSLVVDVHAAIAWAAFACLTLNAGLAVAVLLSDGSPSHRRGLGRSLQAGFFLHSAMLATGSLYKFLLFGRAWSFDPIETLGLATWLAYGTLLHMDLLAAWDSRRVAQWCLFVFVLLVISYRTIVYFPAWSTYHVFDMDLRLHLMG